MDPIESEANLRSQFLEVLRSRHSPVVVIVEPGIGHEVTLSMLKEASDWFDKFLKP
ncbi:hypothetical protein Lser_V15G39468 [Lactuca serriola]